METNEQHKITTRKSYDLLLVMFLIVILASATFWLLELLQHSNLSINKTTVATVANAQQEVRSRKGGDFKWKEAQKGLQLCLRDRDYTVEDSKAEIEVNQTKIMLNENSLTEIGPTKEYNVKLEFGFLILNLKDRPLKFKLKKKLSYQPKASDDSLNKILGKIKLSS
jgi:hypothetical protein